MTAVVAFLKDWWFPLEMAFVLVAYVIWALVRAVREDDPHG